MTRVNCVPVIELADLMLMAEHKEIIRVLSGVCRWGNKSKGLVAPYRPIPKSYRMGTGHVIFFYDKLLYILKRHDGIIAEAKYRGIFKPSYRLWDIYHRNPEQYPDWSLNDWTPDEDAIAISRQRILTNMKKKKYLYEWTKREAPDYVDWAWKNNTVPYNFSGADTKFAKAKYG